MQPHVRLERRLVGECGVADVTVDGKVDGRAVVKTLVDRQRRPDGEAFAADVARVRLLSSVHPHVARQVTRLLEAFAANGALVGQVRCLFHHLKKKTRHDALFT